MKQLLQHLVLLVSICTITSCTKKDNSTSSTTPSSGQVVSDIAVGSESTYYFNVEFSPDMQYMTFTELVGGTNAVARDWLCTMDKNTGNIGGDGTGKQFLLFERTGYSPDKQINPQWGQDTQGLFTVTLDQQGRFLIFRPNGASAPTMTTLSTPANSSRFLPYAARVPNRSNSLIAYTQRDSQNRIQIWAIDMSSPSQEFQITSGNLGVYTPTNSSPITLCIQRWFWPVPGGNLTSGGLPEFIYGFINGSGKLQIRSVDFSTGSPVTKDVTNDNIDHIDDFTFSTGTEKYLVGGVNNSGEGRLYKFDGFTYNATQTIKPSPQTFGNATTCSSFEVFQWKGKYYGLFQILDNNTSALPSGANQETWITSLINTDILFMVTPKVANVRLDPEFYLTTDKIFVFYASRRSNGSRELRRAEVQIP